MIIPVCSKASEKTRKKVFFQRRNVTISNFMLFYLSDARFKCTFNSRNLLLCLYGSKSWRMKRQIYIYLQRENKSYSERERYTYGNHQGLWFKQTKKSSKTYHSRVKSLSKLYLISFWHNDKIKLDFDQKWDEFAIDWYKFTTYR